MNKNLVAIKRPTELLDNPLVLSTVMAGLLNADANVSAAALDTLRKVKDVERRPDFLAAMNRLQTSTNPRLKLIAVSVLKGRSLGDALKDVQPGSVLDFRTLSPGSSPFSRRRVRTARHASTATPAM